MSEKGSEEAQKERAEFIRELKALMEKYEVNIYSYSEYDGNEDYSGEQLEFVNLGWTVAINPDL